LVQGQCYVRGENAMRIESGSNGSELVKALHQESGTNEENEGKSDLRHHQNFLRAACAGPEPLCAPPSFRVLFRDTRNAASTGANPNKIPVRSDTTGVNRPGSPCHSGLFGCRKEDHDCVDGFRTRWAITLRFSRSSDVICAADQMTGMMIRRSRRSRSDVAVPDEAR